MILPYQRKVLATIWVFIVLPMTAASLLVSDVAAGEVKPIGVRVKLTNQLTHFWTSAEKSDVTIFLTNKLVGKLNEAHRHWNFVDPGSNFLQDEIVAQAISLGQNEILLEITLQHYSQSNSLGVRQLEAAQIVSRIVLYRPGQFRSDGRPSSTAAKSLIWEKAEQELIKRQEAYADLISGKVPVAQGPTQIKLQDYSLVLPLPQQRYSHLGWSEFRIFCKRQSTPGQHLNLFSKADNTWRIYDTSTPIALTVIITNPPADALLQDLTPKVVFLEKFVEMDPGYRYAQ